jgi:hypothetical protein
MNTYPLIKIEYFLSGSWVDLTPDVTDNIDSFYGISGIGQLDRVADVGDLSFTLRNDALCLGGVENYYLPGHISSKPGWGKGLPIRLSVTNPYTHANRVKFYGHIDDLQPDMINKTVTVSSLDWFSYASNYPLKLITAGSGMDISQVVTTIVSGMDHKPKHTEYNLGNDTFTTIFDTVKDSTQAISEFNKIALSEWGWIYLKRDAVDGETLVTEGRYKRNSRSNLKQTPLYDGSRLKKEDGSYLLSESGGYLLLDRSSDVSLVNLPFTPNITYGDSLANRVTIKSYPRRVDTSPVVLFNLDQPIFLSGSQTLTYIANYKDPLQQANQVAGKNMITSASTTDYLFNASSSGSGTNLTASLQVTPYYGVSTVFYTLTNLGATPGWITKLTARGYGIYVYNALSYSTSGSQSILDYGEKALEIDQKYQISPSNTSPLADILLTQNQNPITNLESVSFIANVNPTLLNAFLFCDIGDLIYIRDDKNSVDSFKYIQNIKFTISPGGLIYVLFGLVDALSLTASYWLLGTSVLGTDTVLGY